MRDREVKQGRTEMLILALWKITGFDFGQIVERNGFIELEAPEETLQCPIGNRKSKND